MSNKITDFSKHKKYIQNHDLANLFYIYDDNVLGDNIMYYNINRTIMFNELTNVDMDQFYYYTINELDTWNMISYNEYGTTRLWWIICKLNDISDPSVDPINGDILRLLPIEKINQILSKLRGT